MLDETELYTNLKNNHNLTQTDIKNIDNESPLEHQFQNQETSECGWRFDKYTSMTIYFYKTTEMNESRYLKIPLGISAVSNIENDAEYCFLWSVLAYLHTCKNSNTNRVSNYRKHFEKWNNRGFNFTIGIQRSDMHKLEKLKNLSIQKFELNFYQDQKNWKHRVIPIEISKNESDRVVDLLFYKNLSILIERVYIFSGNHKCIFVCRRCFSFYKSRNTIIKNKQRCQEQVIASVRTSNQSHLHWKETFSWASIVF